MRSPLRKPDRKEPRRELDTQPYTTVEEGLSGVIVGIVHTSGYGFIRCPKHDADIFFHVTGLIHPETFPALHGGSKVTFTLVEGDRGPRAVNVLEA